MASKRAPTERKKAKEPAPDAKPAADAPSEPAAAGLKVPPASGYVVFARRFRPRNFSDVVGQSAATGALRQALISGRLAQAYLFCGPRGVGKTSLARIFAKAVNCLNGKGPGGAAEEPCDTCDACLAIQEGRALDVIEMDAATNRGIEEIRTLRDNVGIAPAELRYKVYIIDEVHMLTREAWNAFLKTLEEPPAHVKFIFATTDPNNVPETILSRCQRYDLRRIGPADIVARLKRICEIEKVTCEDAALSRIAGLARGGLRDAEGLLDQAINLAQGKVTDAAVRELCGAAPDELISEILTSCAAGDTGQALARAHTALEAGSDPEDLLAALLEHLRGTLLASVCGAQSPLLEGHAHLKQAYENLGKRFSVDQILMLLQLFTAARRQMRDTAHTRLPLEMALIRAARAGDLVDLGKLVNALETSSPAPVPRPAAPGHPPNREGLRPNSPGRPAGTVDSRPAATEGPQAAGHRPEQRPPPSAASLHSPASGLEPDVWARTVAAVAAQKGGALLASALSHAQSVRFDAAANVLSLGFSSSQLFYRDALEKPQNQAVLVAVLQEGLGRAVAVAVERVETAAPRVSPQPAPAARPPAPPAKSAAPAAPTEIEEAPSEETEIEFDGVGELPLRAPPNPSRDREGAVEPLAYARGSADEGPPPARVAPPPKSGPAVVRDPAQIKALAEHPLVKLILKEVDGMVLGVNRE